MSDFVWQQLEDGLSFREDEFSWQCSSSMDRFFFLRRDKFEPTSITDYNFGEIAQDQVVALFSRFLQLSGGLNGSRIRFLRVSDARESHVSTVKAHDAVSEVGTKAVVALGRTVQDVRLQQDGNSWNSVVFYSN